MCKALPVCRIWRSVERRRCSRAVRGAAEPLSLGRRRRHKPVPAATRGSAGGWERLGAVPAGTAQPSRRRPAPLGGRGVAEPGEGGREPHRAGGAPRPLPAGAAPRGLRRSPRRTGAGSASRLPHPASRAGAGTGTGTGTRSHTHPHTHTPAHTPAHTRAGDGCGARARFSPR